MIMAQALAVVPSRMSPKNVTLNARAGPVVGDPAKGSNGKPWDSRQSGLLKARVGWLRRAATKHTPAPSSPVELVSPRQSRSPDPETQSMPPAMPLAPPVPDTKMGGVRV